MADTNQDNPESGSPVVKIDLVINILTRITTLQDQMEETIDTKNKYRLLLFEPKLLFGYKKDFAAFFVAFNLYKDYCSSVMGAEEIRREINKIRIYDARLALSIENLLGLSNSY